MTDALGVEWDVRFVASISCRHHRWAAGQGATEIMAHGWVGAAAVADQWRSITVACVASLSLNAGATSLCWWTCRWFLQINVSITYRVNMESLLLCWTKSRHCRLEVQWATGQVRLFSWRLLMWNL